jgi:hypothetical protein
LKACKLKIGGRLCRHRLDHRWSALQSGLDERRLAIGRWGSLWPHRPIFINIITNLREESPHLLSGIPGLHLSGQIEEFNHYLFQHPSLDGAFVSGDENFRAFSASAIFFLQKKFFI